MDRGREGGGSQSFLFCALSEGEGRGEGWMEGGRERGEGRGEGGGSQSLFFCAASASACRANVSATSRGNTRAASA